MKTIALFNQKGGVGKTTSAANIGAGLARLGKRVLLIDMDPQANLTYSLGLDPFSLDASIYELLDGKAALADTIRTRDGFDLIPAAIQLAGAELHFAGVPGREMLLRDVLQETAGYDYALIDCPPSLGLLTVAALTAAAGVLVPTLPAAADLRGLRLFLGTLEKLKAAGLNPGLQLVGIIVCQYDKRLNSHKQALEAIQAAGLPVILPPVPRSVRAQEAAGAKQPLTAYDPSGRVTGAYQEITGDIIKWLSQNPI